MLRFTRLSLLTLSLGLVGLAFAVGWTPIGLPFQPGAVFSDAVISHWGAASYTRESVLNGTYPLWRDTVLAGAPFAANPLNKTAYPLQWLVLILPSLTHLNTLIMLHLMLAAWGMWRFARRLSLSFPAAAFSALAYALAPRMVGHLGAGHLDIVYAMAWFPWFMERLYVGVSDREQIGRIRYALGLALVTALMVLADVRVSLFALIFGAVYVLWNLFRSENWRNLSDFALAGAVFVPLVLAEILPLVSWQPYLSRASLSPDGAALFSVSPLGFAGLYIPAHVGSVETMVYVGISVFVLAMIGVFSRPIGERVFWLITLLFFGFWAAGDNTPFWNLLVMWEPLRWFRVPGRAWLVLSLILPLLAGYGVAVLSDAANRWHEVEPPKVVFWWRLLAAATAGLMAVCGGTLLFMGLGDIPTSAAVTLLLSSVLLGGVLLAVLLRRGRSNWVVGLLLLLTVFDLGLTAVARVEWRTPDDWLAPHIPLAVRLAEESPDRIYSPDYALPQQVVEFADLNLFYGVDPFQLSGVVRAIEAGSGVPVEEYSVILPPVNLPQNVDEAQGIAGSNRQYTPDLNTLAYWNVSHVIATYPYENLAGLTYLDTVDGVYIYRNEVYVSRAFDETPPDYMSLLPSAEQITQLHRWTMIAVWVSAASFVLVGLSIAVLTIREVRHGE